jgi:hypothetical protein
MPNHAFHVVFQDIQKRLSLLLFLRPFSDDMMDKNSGVCMSGPINIRDRSAHIAHGQNRYAGFRNPDTEE